MDRDARIATARELGQHVQRYLDGDRDLALRRTLAREHLERARAAFAAGNAAAERATAMREAGRAIALDPTLGDAAALMTRLMLEPPRDVPAQVDQALATHEQAMDRRQARAAARTYLSAAVFIPFLVGYRGGAALVIAFAGLTAMNFGLAVRKARGSRPTPAWFLSLRNAAMVAMIARFFSPFLLAPPIAILATLSPLFTSSYRKVHTVVVLALLMVTAIVGTWAIEAAGLVSTTMHHTADTLIFDVAVPGSSEVGRMVGFIALVTAAIVFCATLAYTMRRAERSLRLQLELQAWQLRQLVPT
jgi:serine/threonine-protein kinase